MSQYIHFKQIAFCLAFSIFYAAVTAQPTTRGRTGYGNSPRNTAQQTPVPVDAYEKKEWISAENDTVRYRLLLPENYDKTKAYPLILFLHGAGERGRDNEKQLTHGARLFVQPNVRKDFPAIVVFPQCPEEGFWSNIEMVYNDTTKKREFQFPVSGEPTPSMNGLLNWLPELEKQYKVSSTQRYILGLSMGGMGTYEIVRRRPRYFAAAVPICGGANPKTAVSIKETAFWIFHGQKDDVVPYQLSEQMVNALNEFYIRAEVLFTLYPQANHNSWDLAFADPDLLPWMFNQRSK